MAKIPMSLCMKLKNADNWEYSVRLVCDFLFSAILFRTSFTGSILDT